MSGSVEHKRFPEPTVGARFVSRTLPYDSQKEVVHVIRRRLFAALATSVMALTFGTTVPAVPAAANTEMGANFVLTGYCDSGGNRMRCAIQNPGGQEPYIIRWYLNGEHRSYYDGEGTINFYCKYVYSVRVEVIDATGQRAELWGNCACNPGDWQ